VTTTADPPIRHSIFERIAWTYTLDPTDQRVLQALATFANYKTGRGASPSLETLAERCHVSKRTVKRSTAQLETGGYVTKTPRHLKSTIYDICLGKLAVDMKGTVLGAKNGPQDAPLGATDGPQDDPNEESLGATDGPQGGLLGAKTRTPLGAKTRTLLGATDGPRSYSTYGSSSTYDPPIQDDPPISTSALRAEISDDDENTTPERSSKVRPISGSGSAHRQRRKRLLQKALRTLLAERNGIPWEDFKAVEIALRTFLQERHIGPNDYSLSDFNDAIIECGEGMRSTAGRRFAHA
jgi:hypothetical protein